MLGHPVLKYSPGVVSCTTPQCSVTASEFQTLPELLGDTQATPNVPQLYVPDKIAVIASHELQALEEMMPPEIVRLDAVTSGVAAPRQIYDVDSLLDVNRFSLLREQRLHWYIIILTVLYTSTILGLLCFSLLSHLPHLSDCWTRNNAPTSDTTYQNPSTSGPSQDASGSVDENSTEKTSYSLHIRYDKPNVELGSGIELATLQQWLQTPRRAPTDEHNRLPEDDVRLPETYGINAAIAVPTQPNTSGQTGARSADCCDMQTQV